MSDIRSKDGNINWISTLQCSGSRFIVGGALLSLVVGCTSYKTLSSEDREEFSLQGVAAIIAIVPGEETKVIPVDGEPEDVKLPQEVGELKRIESISIVTTSKSPDCVWIEKRGTLHKVCD